MNFDYVGLTDEGLTAKIYCQALGRIYLNLSNSIIEIEFEIIDGENKYFFILTLCNLVSGAIHYKLKN
jgi:hypothetical protein